MPLRNRLGRLVAGLLLLAGARDQVDSPVSFDDTDADLPGSALPHAERSQWRATLHRGTGELLETEEGYVDHAAGSALSVRASYGGRPAFVTTVQVGLERWTRSDREVRADGVWVHRAAGAPPGPVPTSDLRLLAAAMGDSLQQALGFVGPASGEVPVRWVVREGRLSGWSVEVDDLVQVAAALGHRPDPRLVPARLRYEVHLRPADVAVPVVPPPAEQVVEDGARRRPA